MKRTFIRPNPIPACNRRWKAYEKMSERDRQGLISEALYLLRTGYISEQTGFASVARRVETKAYKKWYVKVVVGRGGLDDPYGTVA